MDICNASNYTHIKSSYVVTCVKFIDRKVDVILQLTYMYIGM